MNRSNANKKFILVTFLMVFGLSLALVLVLNLLTPQLAHAAPAPEIAAQESGYGGSEKCAGCHKDVHETWMGTLHSQAYSSPIFQEDWAKQGSANSCLECHTTGYDPVTGKFSEEGVTCEACHGPFQPEHPMKAEMPVKPDASLCSSCHKTTTDEWKVSKHGQIGIDCQSCHNPHSQQPKAASVTELCSNCHKDSGSSFTHGTHASAGLQCSDCHMATGSHTSSIGGLFATGHTFTVGSEACISCHKDTVHTRDTIVKLSGGEAAQTVATLEELQKQVQDNQQTIQTLEAQGNVRLYTGLIQGAIVGLITGGAAAWIVSRRIRIVEVDEDGQ